MSDFALDSFYVYFEGAIIMQALLFLCISILFKKKSFLFYTLYLFLLAIYYLINSSALLIGIPAQSPLIHFFIVYLNMPIVMLFNIFYLFFITSFLGLRQYRHIYLLVKIIITVIVVSFVVYFSLVGFRLPSVIIVTILNVINFVGLVGGLLLVVLIIRQKIQFGNYVAAGMLFYAIASIGSAIIVVLRKSDPTVLFAGHPLFFVKLGVFADMFLYFIALISKWINTEKHIAVLAIEKEFAVERERNRIRIDLHDDMGAGLSRIRYMSTAMKKGSKDDAMKKDFDKLIAGSDELVDKMNDIIWILNNNNETLEDLIYYIRSQCSEMLDQAGINFDYKLPEIIPLKVVSSEEKRNLYLFIKEAVHNAIKHAQATKISLSVQILNSLKISVADNGKGFNPEKSKLKGNGLGNYQKRMDILKGTVIIQSNEMGTVVILEVPLL